jgi:5'-3' exonuclease
MYCKTNKNKKILIDGSYLIYCSYFNSSYLYKKQYPKETFNSSCDISKNDKFLSIFYHVLTKNMRKLKKFFNIIYSDIFFVRDCLRETIWRLDIYDKYKIDRKTFVKHQNNEVDLGNFFMEIYNNYLEDLREKMGFNIIKIEEAEADDTIFLLTKLFTNDNYKITIISNDSDFFQIINDNVDIYDISLKKVELKNDPKNLLLYKIFKGDRSDNIYGFRINKKNFYLDYILKLLSHPKGNNLYIRNRKLIDLNYIPLKLKKKVLEYYNTIRGH